MRTNRNIFELFTLSLALFVGQAEGHGRLLVPPARSSRWREGFPVPQKEYNDNANNCGGMAVSIEDGLFFLSFKLYMTKHNRI